MINEIVTGNKGFGNNNKHLIKYCFRFHCHPLCFRLNKHLLTQRAIGKHDHINKVPPKMQCCRRIKRPCFCEGISKH